MPDDALPLEISIHEVHALRQRDEAHLLLDCREQGEWDLVRIEGATLLPMSALVARHGELEPHRGRKLIVYCHVGGRSAQVAAWLRQQGYAQAQSMAGGIDAWADQVEPRMARY